MEYSELEHGLLERINRYSNKNSIEKISTDEARSVMKYLLQDGPKDLGGITALRGFVYQYYVAMHYMVEMLHAEHAWWDEVIFELLDDIALLGSDKIRFVQVKTVREDGQDRHLTPSDFTKRESGLDSWLDNLFMNLPEFERRQEVINKHCVFSKEFCVQFEVATNAPYDNKSLSLYTHNISYQLTEGSIPDSDSLKKGLSKVFSKKIREKSKVICTQDFYFADSVGQQPEWCLERFNLNHLGCMENLKEKIVGKISDYCRLRLSTLNNFSNSKENNRLSGDGLIYDHIARKVFKHLLVRVIERTHRDNLPDMSLHVFTKKNLAEWFEEWQQKALDEIQKDIELIVHRKKFMECFEELKEEIDTSWNESLKNDLLNTLGWMYDALEFEIESGNSFVYEQFINRLFYLNNSRSPSASRKKDEVFLKDSLKYMMVCLAFYPDRNFLFNNAQLLFKQGKQGEEAWSVFTIYCAREKETYTQALRKIVARSKDCLFSQSLQHTYYCFVTHDDKTQSITVGKDPFAAVIPITRNHENNESDIVDQPEHIKFQKQDTLDFVIKKFNEPVNKYSFQDHELREGWHILLKNE